MMLRRVLLCSSVLGLAASSTPSYSNVTLKSNDLEVLIYLPQMSSNEDDPIFYKSTRFEYGSMIGSIKRNGHELYGSDLWKVPHDPYWPESGLGLASEFGVGDDGAFCDYRCGWFGVNNVSNGVLGHREARPGESFLKIGVGELIKGSCQDCDSAENYKFNSPYEFAALPEWTLEENPATSSATLTHEATLRTYGYRIKKDMTLIGNTLLVSSTLTNLGQEPFATVWYSHHFFSCDGQKIGPGYTLELDLRETPYGLYDEPGRNTWSTPLKNYAKVKVTEQERPIKVEMVRKVDPGTRIKAEFVKDELSTGSFRLNACETSIIEDIAELQNTPDDPVGMYALNLYIEEGTLSPEPQILVRLEPGESKTWTQRLVVEDTTMVEPILEEELSIQPLSAMEEMAMANTNTAPSTNLESHEIVQGGIIGLCLVTACVYTVFQLIGRLRRSHRQAYSNIPDHVVD